MGLDIAFNREKAIAAGLVLYKDTVGTAESIAQASDEDGYDAGYIEYLTREREYVRVPNCDYSVENDGITDIIVRANKWGRTYAPLTQWLTENNITWTEF